MNNKQVAHLWANQSRTSARGSNFYFVADTIYSYGHHFPIARLIDPETVLFTTRGYSNTTAKHKSITLQSVCHKTVFHVYNPALPPSENDVKWYRNAISNEQLRLARARTYKNPNHLERLITEGNAFCAKFGFAERFAPLPSADLKAMKKAFRDAARKESEAKKERARLAALKEREAIQEWISGNSHSLPYSVTKVYLRIRNGNLETSKGASVPENEARRAFSFVQSKRQSGWHRNGESFPIGEFNLDSVNEAGIIAGCHRISWDEIDRIGKQEGWSI